MEKTTQSENYTQSLKESFKTKLPPDFTFTMPTQKIEQWKYTSLAKFLPETLDLNESETKLKTEFIKKLGIPSLVFINGKLDEENSTYKDSKDLSIEIKENNDFSESKHLSDYQELQKLNAIAAQKTISITLKNSCADLALQLFKSHESSAAWNFPRFEIKLERSQELKVFEINESTSTGESETLTTLSHFNIHQSENSSLAWEVLKADSNNSNSIVSRNFTLLRNARLNLAQAFLSSKLSRNDIVVSFEGENATANLKGFYLTKEAQHHDSCIVMNHNTSQTYSSVEYKGILSGASRAVFNSLVHIKQDAQQVDSNQLNKNILLSKKAHVDTRPQLLVYADDVKAAHGATVGKIDPEELFYLESRGISEDIAKKMLLNGYFEEMMDVLHTDIWHEMKHQFITTALLGLEEETND
ncbi:MAG: Fe-S cluster assembly protein SufD [Bacteriovoracaceae bacterium]